MIHFQLRSRKYARGACRCHTSSKEPVKDPRVALRGSTEHSKAKAALDGDTANVLPLE